MRSFPRLERLIQLRTRISYFAIEEGWQVLRGGDVTLSVHLALATHPYYRCAHVHADYLKLLQGTGLPHAANGFFISPVVLIIQYSFSEQKSSLPFLISCGLAISPGAEAIADL
jgi:hypothetical protein